MGVFMKIKLFFTISFLLLVCTSQASVVNLNVGDSITLQPNSLTTVTCAGNSEANCKLPIANLNAKFNVCTTQFNSVEDCITKYWPEFNRTNRNCVEEAYSSCLNFCAKSPFSLDCLYLCR